MTKPGETAAARGPGPARLAAAAALIAAATLASYANCFNAPFVYDDLKAIPENPSIRQIWPPWGALFSAPVDSTVAGRPVANLTLGLNYALGGTGVWGYHALNLAIHVLAALALFGIVRRTLARPPLAARFGRDALPLALAAALIWSLHPLQTESVTYVVQRVESLMGLFYLSTLYFFVRSVDSPRPGRWQMAAAAACLLGMATKEVMATAPLMVLLYDRTFAAGSFRKAWQARRGLYLALAATWLPLLALVAATGWNRGGSVGFGAGVPAWNYWMTQFEAVARYAGLAVWPGGQVFEYGPFRFRGLAEAAPFAAAVAALGAATLLALRSRPVLGFLGAWFFVILAPSSFVPIATQTMAEHRMYVPLAAFAVGAVALAHALGGRRSWPILGLLALGLGLLTARRNEVYRSGLALWGDTVAKRPANPNARNNLGLELFHAGRVPEAVVQYREALKLLPSYPGALNNLGNALDQSGRTDEAIGMYEGALRLEPHYAAAHYNLARALERAGRTQEALPHFEESLRLEPGFAKARFDLANAQVQAGQIQEAIGNYEEVLRVQPDLAEASNNLGIVLCRLGRVAEGIGRIEDAIRSQPDYAQARFAHATALLQAGRRDEAVAEYERVLQLRPNDPAATRMLEMIRSRP